MFFKFFDWLKKRYECESKKDFRKTEAEVDNATKVDDANSVNIKANANIKTDGEIVKDLTDKVGNVNNINNDSVTKDLLNVRERLNFAREKYYAANIAGRIIKKVLDKGIVAVQSKGIALSNLGDGVFIDFGKIYRLKGLKFMGKGVIVQSGVIEKMGNKGNRSWEINISVPEFYKSEDCGKIIGWEERDIVGEFKKEIESVMNCEYEQNFRVINIGVCKFIDDEELVRKIVKEAIWEEFGWNENGNVNGNRNGNGNGNGGRVNGENLSNENFGKVFFPKTGEWVDVRGKCEDVNGEFIGDVCKEIVEGIKKFGVGREKFGIGNDGMNGRDCGKECGKDGSREYGKDYRKLTVNVKIRKGEVWRRDSGNDVRNRWMELGKDVRDVIGSVGKEGFLDMARRVSELMKYVEEKYGVEKVEEIQREVEKGNRRIRECRKEIEGIVGGNGGMDECGGSEGYDSEAMEEAMVRMEETVGEVEERLKEVMGEEIWERYRGIIGEE